MAFTAVGPTHPERWFQLSLFQARLHRFPICEKKPMKTLATFLFLTLLSILAHGQSAKEIKENKVKSVTIWQNDKDEIPLNTYKVSYETFDKQGNTLLKIKFDTDGSTDSKVSYRYDKNQNKTEEIEYNGDNEIVSHKLIVYNAFGKKTEERELSPSGDLLTKTVFSYNSSGDKSAETTMNAKGDILKTTEYQYNSRKLKTQRTTTNKTKQVESLKKWTYEYY